jgi:hypothetical protein
MPARRPPWQSGSVLGFEKRRRNGRRSADAATIDPYRTSPFRIDCLIGYDTAKRFGAGCRDETAHLRRRLSGLTNNARHCAGAGNEADEAAGDDPRPAGPVSIMTPNGTSYYKVFFEELARLGYVEGQNLIVLRFSAEGHEDRYGVVLQQAIDAAPDVIFCASAVAIIGEKTTMTIPVVASVGDPVAERLTTSLARPSRNIRWPVPALEPPMGKK